MTNIMNKIITACCMVQSPLCGLIYCQNCFITRNSICTYAKNDLFQLITVKETVVSCENAL